MAGMDRRGFLQASTLLATSAVLAKANRAVAANEELRIGLVGAGGQGQRVWSYMLKAPGTRGVAITDALPSNAKAANAVAGGNAKIFTDWKEMLAEANLDAVLVALPEHLHAPATIDALKAGCHVFCEKPMAYSIEEGQSMIRAANEAGKVLQIGQQRRCNPLYYRAVELAAKEPIVRVDAFWDRWEDWKRPLPTEEADRKIDATKFGYPDLEHLVNWRLYRAYGHGLMTENGTHQLDAASWFLGGRRPQYVNGVGVSLYRDGRETHDVVSSNYVFDGDIVVRFHQDFHQGFNYGWDYGELILSSAGTIRITGQSELATYGRKDRNGPGHPVSASGVNQGKGWEIPGISLTAKELDEIESMMWFSYEAEMRSFAHCCRTGATPACTATIGHNSIVPTIVGTEAQFNRETIPFQSAWWA